MINSHEHLFKSIIDKFSHAMASPAKVKDGLNELHSLIVDSSKENLDTNLEPLIKLLQRKSGESAQYIFSFLKEVANSCDNPEPIIKALINSRDKKQLFPALELTASLVNKGTLKIDNSFIGFLASCFIANKPYFNNQAIALKIIEIIENGSAEKSAVMENSIQELYQNDSNIMIRLLTAWLMDKSTKTVNRETAEVIIGKKMYKFFKHFLMYTRATYTNLLYLQMEEGGLTALREDLKIASSLLGEKLLLEVIAKLGWNRLNLGLSLESIIEINVDESPSYLVPEAIVPLALKCKGAKRGRKLFKVVSCGNEASVISSNVDNTEKINRFRTYNLNHAALLNYFLDITPLTINKIRSIISLMDRVVNDYVYLFSPYNDSCSILPEVYDNIKKRILDEINNHDANQPLSADLMRTVLFFEEPHSIGEISTLHGLKRYLHQSGLSMGSKLAAGGRAPNRTVDILLVSEKHISFSYNKIQFSDFDSTTENNPYSRNIPYSVGLLIESFFHLMVYGQKQFPKVDIFCYGNEVHHYFGFRNHPAFLRIDYAPPLQGGMIDLEYFGVSNYNLNDHPNVDLDAIQLFFSSMDFNIELDGTRIHARYDKERALTLGDLCKKATMIFNLAPYFMDLDWIIGSLAIETEARKKVAVAWAEFFIHWGFIPINTVLTNDRLGIISAYIEEPTKKREIIWNGENDYNDIYSSFDSNNFYKDFLQVINDSKLQIGIPKYTGKDLYIGQSDIQAKIINPIQQAISRGELFNAHINGQQQTVNLFSRINEVEIFAKHLNPDSEELIYAIGIAGIVQHLERILSFTTTGSINGFIIQSTILELRGESISFYVLRGEDNMVRLAFFTLGLVLFKARRTKSSRWVYNANFDTSTLVRLLRANNFIDSSIACPDNSNAEYNTIYKEIKRNTTSADETPLRNERIIIGLKASPGLSVGKVIFGTEGHEPHDFKGSILVASSLKPQDTSSLYYADGIISTGGGILSHAGLVAMQLQKPAIIISGKWVKNPLGNQVFYYSSNQYQIKKININGFNVSVRSNIHKKEFSLNEGDLVIVNALSGIVNILGHGRNVLALHENFKLYKSLNSQLLLTKKTSDILNLRGKRLRAIHQIEHVLKNSDEPIISRYTIFEILLNNTDHENITLRDKGLVLKVLLNNPNLSNDTRSYLDRVMNELTNRLRIALLTAEKNIPTSNNLFEIISNRINIKHHFQSIESTKAALQASDFKTVKIKAKPHDKVHSLIRRRISFLQKNIIKSLNEKYLNNDNDPLLRHLIQQLDRINKVYPNNIISEVPIIKIQEKLFECDKKSINKQSKKIIVENDNCGFELFNQIGWKAANLGEIGRLITENNVPSWFVVTDYAFKEVLKLPVNDKSQSKPIKYSLWDAILSILSNDDLDDEQKSKQILGLWERIELPSWLIDPIISAYKTLTNGSETISDHSSFEPYVAVRSSSTAEDTESDARAGEFETFLYIKGKEQLLLFIKRTWSGLWTQRAIHNRRIMHYEHNSLSTGIIVQRMVDSRVSGVLQTVNIPRDNIREMVINAGLGLGEGIVSGVVAADQITIAKDIDMEKDILHFNYITSDKIERVVFNDRSKSGTIRLQTLYHQRLRPALEYFELCELVKVAASLEKSYGYPLDIEFGIEGEQLWILQVRPVTAFQAVLSETLNYLPLKKSKKSLKRTIV